MPMTTIDPQHAADLHEGEDGDNAGPWTRVGEQHIRTARWMEHYYLVVSNEAGETFGLPYAVGLTEEQEHDLPWEEIDEPLTLVRLYPHRVTTTVYRETP